MPSHSPGIIEDPCSKLQGIFDRKECSLLKNSITYPAASGGECARFRGSHEEWFHRRWGLLTQDPAVRR